jgi:hypothetical protein
MLKLTVHDMLKLGGCVLEVQRYALVLKKIWGHRARRPPKGSFRHPVRMLRDLMVPQP